MTDSIEDTKAGLRGLVRERLRALSSRERARLSGAACEQALAWQPLREARRVLAFAPMPSEVAIEPLIEALLAAGVCVCVPRTDWTTRSIEAVPIQDLDSDLDVLDHGVRQPRQTLPPAPLESIQALVVPGVAFDCRGGRLGRGGGFYDRVIGGHPDRTPVLGIAFEAQVLEAIPMEAHDRAVDALATPVRLMEFGTTERARAGT